MMKTPLFCPALVASAVLVLSGASAAQNAPRPQAPTEIVAPAIPGVIASGTKIQLVKGGFRRTEGPVGAPDGSILFTDAGKITKIDARGNVSTYVEKSNDANGLGFDSKGRLIAVQRLPKNEKVGVLDPSGTEVILADSIDGKPFSRLNDLVVGRTDRIYFTDENGVYYLPPGGKVTTIDPAIANPNGVMLSPDEKTLYANDKDGQYVIAYEVAPDGTVRNRRNFAKYKSVRIPGHKDPLLDEDNGADGMAIDTEGRLYIATNEGVEVFSPTGNLLGVIPAVFGGEQNDLQKPQNVTFGGPDRKTLYMVGAGLVFKVQTLAQGVQGRGK
jgi:gluconolactonase